LRTHEDDLELFLDNMSFQNTTIIKAIIIIWTFCSCTFAHTGTTVIVNPANVFFIGLAYIYNDRTGYYDFDEIKTSQQIARSGLHMFGAVAGKRFPLYKFLRFQIGISVDGGRVTDDTLYYSYTSAVKYTYIHCGLEPEIQITMSKSADYIRPYLSAGCGFNYTYIKERTYSTDNGIEILWIDQPYINKSCLSLSAITGAGVDIKLSQILTMNLLYSFRLWQPVNYEIEQDFILDAQKYHENFYSHKIALTLLFDVI
jgi:hypothetical protein